MEDFSFKGFKKGRKPGVSKQAWLDWLSDEPPAPAVQQDMRRERVARANQYQARHPVAPPPVSPAQHSVAHPPVQPQAQAAPQATQKPQGGSQPPAAVSIQIQIPAFSGERFRQFKHNLTAKPQAWWQWTRDFVAGHRRESITGGVVVAVIVLGVFVPPLFFSKQASQAKKTTGTASSGSAGASTGYDKPPFTVVTPSGKSKLATPDGKVSAYDGKRNTYSFSDSISGNGFIVSQQPVPPTYQDGPDAVDQLSKKIGTVPPEKAATLFGDAYISTNPKTSAQTVIVNVRDLLVFIQSAHAFTTAQWTSYINTLQ